MWGFRLRALIKLPIIATGVGIYLGFIGIILQYLRNPISQLCTEPWIIISAIT